MPRAEKPWRLGHLATTFVHQCSLNVQQASFDSVKHLLFFETTCGPPNRPTWPLPPPLSPCCELAPARAVGVSSASLFYAPSQLRRFLVVYLVSYVSSLISRLGSGFAGANTNEDPNTGFESIIHECSFTPVHFHSSNREEFPGR